MDSDFIDFLQGVGSLVLNIVLEYGLGEGFKFYMEVCQLI